MRLPRSAARAGSSSAVVRVALSRPVQALARPPSRCAATPIQQCSTSGRCVSAQAALAMSSPGSSNASPVQDEKHGRAVPQQKAQELEGNDIPFDVDAWTAGQVHEIKSPAEFKAFVMERSHVRPIIMMCKARACRPCKVFSRTYAKAAGANPDVIFLSVVGDETPALRRMMVLLGVKSTPFFVTYRNAEHIHQHGGNSDEKLQKALDIAHATMADAAQSGGGAAAAAGS